VKSINVLGKIVLVKKVKGFAEKTNLLGQYDSASYTITVDATQKEFAQTFMHECMHAVFDRIGFHNQTPLECEEMICDSLANFLVENFDIKPKRR